jgi:hypothetical protein
MKLNMVSEPKVSTRLVACRQAHHPQDHAQGTSHSDITHRVDAMETPKMAECLMMTGHPLDGCMITSMRKQDSGLVQEDMASGSFCQTPGMYTD